MPKVTHLTDGNGNVVATREYDAFGNILSETGSEQWALSRHGYHPNWIELKDSGGKICLSPSRLYDVQTGRFLQREPRKGLAGDYKFARQDPARYVDPDGREAHAWTSPSGGGPGGVGTVTLTTEEMEEILEEMPEDVTDVVAYIEQQREEIGRRRERAAEAERVRALLERAARRTNELLEQWEEEAACYCFRITEREYKIAWLRRGAGVVVVVIAAAYGVVSNVYVPAPDPTDAVWINALYWGLVKAGGWLGPGILAGVGVEVGFLREYPGEGYRDKVSVVDADTFRARRREFSHPGIKIERARLKGGETCSNVGPSAQWEMVSDFKLDLDRQSGGR